MSEKLNAAVIYLRLRNKYIIDNGCKFTPTNKIHTDVAETIRLYRRKVKQINKSILVPPLVKIGENDYENY